MFKKFFGKNKEDSRSGSVVTKYSPKLIDNLIGAHQALFEKYGEIKETFLADNEKWHTIMDLFNELETSLKLHIALENKQLYSYLENHYKEDGDTEHLEHLKTLQKEMGDIMKTVKYFSKKYSDWENYKRNKHAFMDDLDTIGIALTKSVKMEENFIYPMYEEGH